MSAGSKAGKSVPSGKYCEQEATVVESWLEASAPQRSSRRAADRPASTEAASSARTSGGFDPGDRGSG